MHPFGALRAVDRQPVLPCQRAHQRSDLGCRGCRTAGCRAKAPEGTSRQEGHGSLTDHAPGPPRGRYETKRDRRSDLRVDSGRDVPDGLLPRRYSECFDNEKPAHPVAISLGFWIGPTEVTQRAYQSLIGTNASQYIRDKLPAASQRDGTGYRTTSSGPCLIALSVHWVSILRERSAWCRGKES